MSQGATPSLFGDRLLDDIRERGYAEFAHGISPGQIADVVGTYADFTLAHPDPEPETMLAMLPLDSPNLYKELDELAREKDTQKGWHKYRTNATGVGKPNGYTNRAYQEGVLTDAGIHIPTEDPKEFYHYTPRHYTDMVNNHAEFGWGAMPNDLQRLERVFRPVHAKATSLLLRVLSLVEETHPDVRQFFDSASLLTSPVRLLLYHPGAPTDCLGTGHYDKSSMTIQIAESHKGLRVATGEEDEMRVVSRSSDQAVVFPGRNFREHFGKDTPFQPAWHDVILTDELNDGREVPLTAAAVCARWALIFFANGANFRNPDKDKMHTRAT